MSQAHELFIEDCLAGQHFGDDPGVAVTGEQAEPALTGALLDRLTHHVHTVVDSQRFDVRPILRTNEEASSTLACRPH